MKEKSSVTRKTLIFGVALVVLGLVLLFWTQNFLEGLGRWWPAVVTALGGWLMFKGLYLPARPQVVFLGVLAFGNGVFMLLFNNVLEAYFTLAQLWPVFIGIVGISLIPYGIKVKRRSLRITLVVPGIFLVALSFFFLLFSLKVINGSFSQFVVAWWPIFLVFMGLILIVTYYFRTSGKPEDPADSSKTPPKP